MACKYEMLPTKSQSHQDEDRVTNQHKQTMVGGRLNRTIQRTYVGRRSGCSQPVLILLLVLSALVFVFFQMASLIPKRPAPVTFGWGSNAVRDLRVYVRPDIETSLLHPGELCKEPPYVLIMVPSAINNTLQRDTIRRTWGQWAGYQVSNIRVVDGGRDETKDEKGTKRPFNVLKVLKVPARSAKMVFILGLRAGSEPLSEEVKRESERHGDVLVEDFVDSYTNLTLKTVFMLKYVHRHCPGANYVVKADDDIFINVHNLQKSLGEGANKSVLSGTLICGAKPIHNQWSKWYTPRYMFREGKYPNYLSGTGYIMSGDIIKPLLDAAISTPYFHLEDVFLTGICAKKIGVRPTDNIGFSYQPRAISPCMFKEVIMGHNVVPVQMARLWNMLNQPNVLEKCHPLKKSQIRDYFPSKCNWR